MVYLLILITIIDLALLNLKQMLEVLTAQMLGLGVRLDVRHCYFASLSRGRQLQNN